MNIFPTELNQRLAGWVRNRTAADDSIINGRARFWKLLGIGCIAFGIGGAIGIALYGYSYVTRNSENIKSLSAAFSKALGEARLKATAEGVVQLEPREISLAKGQTVSLDNNSRVLLDPAAKVLVDGDIRVQAPPTISVPQNVAQRSTSSVPEITNFTVFKRIAFEKGTVVTGWTFLTSSQKLPNEEYCYYTENAETPGVQVDLILGSNRQPELLKTAPKNFDVAAAFNRCVWYKSENR